MRIRKHFPPLAISFVLENPVPVHPRQTPWAPEVHLLPGGFGQRVLLGCAEDLLLQGNPHRGRGLPRGPHRRAAGRQNGPQPSPQTAQQITPSFGGTGWKRERCKQYIQSFGARQTNINKCPSVFQIIRNDEKLIECTLAARPRDPAHDPSKTDPDDHKARVRDRRAASSARFWSIFRSSTAPFSVVPAISGLLDVLSDVTWASPKTLYCPLLLISS